MQPFDLERSLGELARRYLRAFAPADERDFAKWSGLPLGEVRVGLAQVERKVAVPRLPRAGVVRLIPDFDNYLLGHADRAFIAPAERWPRIGPGGGIIWGVILLDGVALGTWKARRTGEEMTVTLSPFEPLGSEVRRQIDAEVADIGRFEGRDAALAGA
jgi:hypothetical protein